MAVYFLPGMLSDQVQHGERCWALQDKGEGAGLVADGLWTLRQAVGTQKRSHTCGWAMWLETCELVGVLKSRRWAGGRHDPASISQEERSAELPSRVSKGHSVHGL